MTKKNILERLVKLAAFSALLSASSYADTPAQESPSKEAAEINTLTLEQREERRAMLKDWVETAVKSEGKLLFLYKDGGGNITWGIGTKYTPELFEIAEFRHTDGTLLSKSEKIAYLRAARKINSTAYGPFEKLAKKMGVSIPLGHAKKLAMFELENAWEVARGKIQKRHGFDIDELPHGAKIALADVMFNVGTGGIMQFRRLIGALKTGDLETAKKHLSVNAAGSKNVAREAMKKLCLKWAIAEENGKDVSSIMNEFKKFNVSFPSIRETKKREILLAGLQPAKIYEKPKKQDDLVNRTFSPAPFNTYVIADPVFLKLKDKNSFKG